MKSTWIIVILSMILSVYAGKVFNKIGEYTDVKVLRVTAKGITISHSLGINTIDVKQLSDEDRALLAEELKQYYEIQKNIITSINNRKQTQGKVLSDLMKNLPQMSYHELLVWSRQKTGCYINSAEFKKKFYTTFSYAENKNQCFDAILIKVKSMHNKQLLEFINMLTEMSPDDIEWECKKKIGKRYSSKYFRQALKQQFWYADKDKIDMFFNKIAECIKIHHNNEEMRLKTEAEEKRRQEEEKRKKYELEQINNWKRELSFQNRSYEETEFPVYIDVKLPDYGIPATYDYCLYRNNKYECSKIFQKPTKFIVNVKPGEYLRVEITIKDWMGDIHARVKTKGIYQAFRPNQTVIMDY